jgi:MFS transporter, DHA1 family, inner membrane transport protein
MAVLALLLVVFAFTTGEFVIAGVLPEVASGLSVSVPAAGLLVSAYGLGMIVGGPVVTTLTARLGRKRLMLGLILVSLLGNLVSALAPGYAVLLAARFVSGLVVATFFAVGIATAVSVAPPGRAGSAVARVTLGLNLGIVLGAPLGTAAAQQFDWRAPFFLIAGLTVMALAMVARFVPPQPALSTGSVADELRVFAGRDVRLAIVLTALGNVGVVTVFTYLAPLLTDVGGFAAGAVPVLLLGYGAGAVFGNFLGGWLADRALMPALLGLLGALAAVLALFWWLSPFPVPAAVLTVVTGALAFAIIPGMQTRVLTTASAAPTLALAVNASGFQVAATVAGWLGGWIIDSGLGVRTILPVAALTTVAGLALAGYAMRRSATMDGAPVG